MMDKILIFGGAGSLGTELVKFYINTHNVCVISRDEAKHWSLRNKINNNNLKTIICDVRDEARVHQIILEEKPEIIIIAHALKQIDICEKFPEESIKTNILGIVNIINSLKQLNLLKIYYPKTVCFISTDKAPNSISVYGLCKAISEKLILNLSENLLQSKSIIIRYGNVLSSKGSIIPLLLKQAHDPDVAKFTLTHDNMTRFVMTLSQGVQLIDTALTHGDNGDIWVPKLSSMKIQDLITLFSQKFNKSYEITGLRCAEKIHEIMLTSEEAIKSDIKDNYFVFNNKNNIKNNLTKEYSSADHLLSIEELKENIKEFLYD